MIRRRCTSSCSGRPSHGITEIDGIGYGSFIVPDGHLSLLTQISPMRLRHFLSKFTGTIYELLSAPVSAIRDRHGSGGGGRRVNRPRPDHLGTAALLVP